MKILIKTTRCEEYGYYRRDWLKEEVDLIHIVDLNVEPPSDIVEELA